MRKYDAVVIGFGKGGKTLSVKMAKQGMHVAMIERSSQMYGGTCINVACIPTKTLVYSAHLSATIEGSFEEKAAFYVKAIEEKNAFIEKLRAKIITCCLISL